MRSRSLHRITFASSAALEHGAGSTRRRFKSGAFGASWVMALFGSMSMAAAGDGATDPWNQGGQGRLGATPVEIVEELPAPTQPSLEPMVRPMQTTRPAARPQARGERQRLESDDPETLAQRSTLPEQAIQLSVGQAHVLAESNLRRVAVGNGRVLQVTQLDAKQLLLMPDAAGQSTLHLWLANGMQRRYRVIVTERDSMQVRNEVQSLIGVSDAVVTRVVGDKVVIESTQPTEEEAFRISEVQKRYPQVVNLASRTGFERMVNMEVRMIEIGRNALERLGVQWQSRSGTPWAIEGPTFGVIGDFSRGAAFRPDGGGAAVEGFPVRGLVNPFSMAASLVSSVSSMVDLMVSSGDAAVLAEPRLSCRSGGSAKFVAGGELPIPVIAANGAASVQFKEYGVRFEVAPIVNSLGIISATLQAEISSINPEVKVKDVPGLRKQSAQTQVNLREGETLVIAGMVSNEMSHVVDRLPMLGTLPVLGPLFRSRRFQDRETEMIVLITPRLDGASDARNSQRTAAIEQKLEAVRNPVRMYD